MMNKMTGTAKAIVAIGYFLGLAMYNVCLFVIVGFEEHNSPFWTGYGFMMGAFVLLGITVLLLRTRFVQPRDWLFGYPVLKHSAIYLVVEFVLSSLFMCLDEVEMLWWIPFLVQLIVLSIHLFFLLSCFFVQEAIIGVQKQVKKATVFTGFLQANVETIAAKVQDPEAKKAFLKLAEQVRFSDPVSNPKLAELEQQINAHITNADYYVMNNDMENALRSCESAKILLEERNKKTKALK